MLHCLVAHKIFLDAKSVIALLKLTLYAQLDVVDECVSKPARNRGKEDLEKMTVELHYISRMIDPLIANADMTATIMREMKTSHDRYCDSQPGANTSNAAIKTSDSIRYLLESAVSQKRWLVSYKSRKDVTLNLVSPLPNSVDYSDRGLNFCRSSISLLSKMRRLALLSHERLGPTGPR
jgi:hypothetical protein